MSERAFPVPDAVTQPFWDGVAEGVRMMTRLVDVAPVGVTVGMPVEVAIQGEPRLPYFRPR